MAWTSPDVQDGSPPVTQVRTALAARLRERLPEIEQAAMARAHAVSDPGEVDDPEYAVGVRAAVGAALRYGIAGIEAGEGRRQPPPPELLSQARAASRAGVSLDTVLRRYFAGYSLLADSLIEEAQLTETPAATLKPLLRREAALFEFLLEAIADAYTRESEAKLGSAAERRAELIERLLAGEPVDAMGLRYRLDAWHLAAIAAGPNAVEALHSLAEALGRSLLLACRDQQTLWAWLGGGSRLSAGETLRLAERSLPPEVSLALGEPGEGLGGWRLTHRQAKAAMLVARHGSPARVRYADVALLSAAIQDEVLASSLRDIYLGPLERGRDGGLVLRQTLAGYLAAGQNASSAAAALGVTRKTVSLRLRSIAEKIGRPVDGSVAELSTALRLWELAHGTPSRVGEGNK